MPRGLDHVVHAVRDLDAAAALYRSLGFQVGSRNRHPPRWGTQNHIVQLPGFFVELLAVADPTQITPHGPRFFSFGAFNRDAIARGEGLSMLVLESDDARADAAAFRGGGIGDFEPFDSSAKDAAPTARRSRSRSRSPSRRIRAPTSASSPASSTIPKISGTPFFNPTSTPRPRSPAW